MIPVNIHMAALERRWQAGAMPLPVFFTPRMVADSGSMSPSAAKPAAVVRAWRERGLAIEIREPEPVSIEELARVHGRAQVEEILACRAPNGFGNCSPAVAASLVYTSGSMLSAARHAVAHRTIASAPCSGFHHAGQRPSGFCTFNGLVVTVCALRAEGRADRIGILDCDMHYGNGTDELIARLDLAPHVVHYTSGAEYGDRHHAREFLARLPDRVRSMSECDVVLYQAGADPHIDDPLGGWLTTEQLRRRDEIVFDTCAALGLPVAWNLAGGYQVEPDGSIPALLEIHENSARAAIAALARFCAP
jgi:acetoin utilization deacetylase AcuC-like enzyme